MSQRINFHNLRTAPDYRPPTFSTGVMDPRRSVHVLRVDAADHRPKRVQNVSADSRIFYWPFSSDEVTNNLPVPTVGDYEAQERGGVFLEPGESTTLTTPHWLGGGGNAAVLIDEG